MALAAVPFGCEGQTPKPAAVAVLDRKLSQFQHKGSFEELLEALAVQLRPSGVIGVENTLPSTTQLTLSLGDEPTVREILSQLCEADGRHRFVLGGDARIVNVLLKKPDKLNEIMETKVARFDMSIDAWPISWYSRVPEFSSEVENMLDRYYRQREQLIEAGGAGANMESDVKPPHIELHLSETTVLDILNSIAAKELDWAVKQNASLATSGVSYPVFPLGWQAELRSTAGVPLRVWITSAFGPFPPARH